MIDFNNKSVIKLSLDKNPKEKDVLELLAPGEQVVSSYSSMRDYVVFTNTRHFPSRPPATSIWTASCSWCSPAWAP